MAGTEAARARPSLHLDQQKQAVHDKRKTTAEEGTESDGGGGRAPLSPITSGVSQGVPGALLRTAAW